MSDGEELGARLAERMDRQQERREPPVNMSAALQTITDEELAAKLRTYSDGDAYHLTLTETLCRLLQRTKPSGRSVEPGRMQG